MTHSSNLEVKSMTVTTHTAIYNIHQAPYVPLNYYYYPENEMEVKACKVVWIDYNEPTGVTLIGTDLVTGKPAEKDYGIPQAPAWVFKLLQHNLGDMGWEILKDKE